MIVFFSSVTVDSSQQFVHTKWQGWGGSVTLLHCRHSAYLTETERTGIDNEGALMPWTSHRNEPLRFIVFSLIQAELNDAGYVQFYSECKVPVGAVLLKRKTSTGKGIDPHEWSPSHAKGHIIQRIRFILESCKGCQFKSENSLTKEYSGKQE